MKLRKSGIVSHGQVGFIYRDQQEFLYYIHQLMENEKLRNTMGVLGQKYVSEHHSLKKEAEAFLDIYRNIFQKGKSYQYQR